MKIAFSKHNVPRDVQNERQHSKNLAHSYEKQSGYAAVNLIVLKSDRTFVERSKDYVTYVTRDPTPQQRSLNSNHGFADF